MAEENQLPPEELQPLKEHPFYTSGLAQASAGQWNQALQTFQSLQTLYPDDAELQGLLKEAQMRGTLSQLQPKHRKKRRRISGGKRWAIALVAIAGVAIVGYLAYSLWLSPIFFQEWRIQQIIRLRQQADEAIASGDYTQARQSLEQLQQLLPQDPQAVETLHKVEQLEQVTQLYNQGKTLLQAENWDDAIATLTELQTLDSQYRDSRELLQQAQEFKALDKRFQAAGQSLAAGQWEAALSQFNAIQQDNITFKYDSIQKRLFEGHLGLGHQFLANSNGAPEKITAALSHIEMALKINPVDAVALDERHIAETYLNALNSKTLDDKINLLQTLHNQRAEAIQQDVAQLLYAALLERAASSARQGNPDAAVEDVQRAIKLPVKDPSAAQETLSNLLAGTPP